MKDVEAPAGVRLVKLAHIADLTKKFRLYDWKGHGRITQELDKFKQQHGYLPKVVKVYKDAYFIETNIPVEDC